MDCSSPGSSAHGICLARVLEWVSISFSKGSSWPRDWTHVSYIGRWTLYHWATREHTHSSFLNETITMKLLVVFIKLRVKRREAGRHIIPVLQTLLPLQPGLSSHDQLTALLCQAGVRGAWSSQAGQSHSHLLHIAQEDFAFLALEENWQVIIHPATSPPWSCFSYISNMYACVKSMRLVIPGSRHLPANSECCFHRLRCHEGQRDCTWMLF